MTINSLKPLTWYFIHFNKKNGKLLISNKKSENNCFRVESLLTDSNGKFKTFNTGDIILTTNTYTNLCDSVGAYEVTYTYDIEGINWFGGIFTQTFTKKEFKEDSWRWLTKQYRSDRKVVKVNKNITYPPATAEQRERLEELIYSKAEWFVCYKWISGDISGYKYTFENPLITCFAKTKPDALYALTHKLVAEGVLSKEEVKEALTNVKEA